MESEKRFYTLPDTSIVLVAEGLQNAVIYTDVNKSHTWENNVGQTIGCGLGYITDRQGGLSVYEWNLLPNGTKEPIASPKIIGLTVRDLIPCRVSVSKIDMTNWGIK